MSFFSTIILIVSLIIMLFPVYFSIANGKRDILSPPAIFSFGFTMSYGFKGWLVSLDPDTFLTYPDIFVFDQNATIVAFILSWLGLIMFFVGYYMKRQRADLLCLQISFKSFKLLYVIAVLFSILALLSASWLLSVASPYILLNVSLIGTEHSPTLLRDSILSQWTDFPWLFQFLVYAGFFGMVAIHAKIINNKGVTSNKLPFYSTFFTSMIIIVSLAILGSRQILLTFILALVLYRHYYLKPISFKKQLIMLILLVLAGGYFGIIQKSLDPEITKAQDMPFIQKIPFRLSSSYEQHEVLVDIIGKDPPLEWGLTILEDIFITYIPKILWASKPTVFGYIKAQNVIFPSYYWGYAGDTTYPIGVLGELYLNFWYIGIPIGMFFLGFIIKAMQERSKVSQSLWPPIFVNTVALFLAPHRTFGTILMVLCLYILFSKMIQLLDILYNKKWKVM